MLPAERELLEHGLRHATSCDSGAGLDDRLLALGWHDALAHDMAVAVEVLFEHQGAAHSTSSALDDVICAALGADLPPGCAVALPTLGSARAPGTVDDGRVAVRGLGTARLGWAPTVLVVGSASDGAVLPGSALDVTHVRGMDDSLGLVEVAAVCGDPTWVPLTPTAWPNAVRAAQLAIGHEMVGASAAMLALACDHARGRIQFDRPIAAFQAVRHRLADTLVAVESARAVLQSAWEDSSGTTASMAKAVAGRAARTAARHCQQVLAGIGFTAEHPFHRYVRRVLVLDELFGSSRSLTWALGTELVASRRLPPPLAL
jgi:hypothetical protein